jgi:hypothetical protein
MSEQAKESILSKIGGILIALLGQKAVKQIIVSQLKKLAQKTDNEIDDQVVTMIDHALNNTKDVALVKGIYEKWSGKTLVEDTSES